MRKPEQTSEPSIEEILASIRRIIADDGAQAKSAAADTAVTQTMQHSELETYDAEDYWARSVSRQHAESNEPAEPAGDAGILELTEDFMVVDRSTEATADQSLHGGNDADGEQTLADAAAAGLADGDADQAGGLQTILSSVAAEVDRLSSGKPVSANLAEPFTADDAFAEPKFSQPARAETTPAPRPQPAGNLDAGKVGQTVKTQAAPAPTPPRPLPAARSGARPVWSARHLENDPDGQSRSAPPSNAAKSEPAPPPRSKPFAARDSWADGIQMPVPESGPAIPPFPTAHYDEEEAAPPLSGSGEARPEIEKEKSFVGDMLNRVFGGQPKRSEEVLEETPGLKGKAEKLARSTISDFAAEKLGAPAVADALQADKPFMEAITDSLENALASNERAKAKPGIDGDKAALEALGDDLPEALIPPDPEVESFANALDASHGMPMAAEPQLAVPMAQPDVASNRGADEPQAPRADSHPPVGRAPQTAPMETAGRPARANDETPPTPHGRAGAETSFSLQSLATPPTAADIAPPPSTPPLAVTTELPSGLEDAIKDMIKPLIVQWLNDNLPRIVEKAVREEIAEQSLLSPQRSGVRR
ncbi:MAG: DUF2497 domain-containing protein [Rhodomicrobium sp.]|nr:DUF2497 domain-containing protein [Rhodomicrobium sp.]